MRQTIEKTWDLLECAVNQYKEKCPDVLCDENAKDRFDEIFRNWYAEIKKDYMNTNVQNLDRHKVASILMVSIIKSEAIKYNGQIPENQVFFGGYLIAASVGFSFMMDQLNRALMEKGVDVLEGFVFPEPVSCRTRYFDVFCRNLYYAEKNEKWGLNPLELAEKLFLLEYITLRENNIDPGVLKE